MAASSSASMPHVTEKPMAKTGASTEKIPFMPQAQGTSAGASALSRSMPRGRKLPRQEADRGDQREDDEDAEAKASPASRGRRGKASVLSRSTTSRDGVGA